MINIHNKDKPIIVYRNGLDNSIAGSYSGRVPARYFVPILMSGGNATTGSTNSAKIKIGGQRI